MIYTKSYIQTLRDEYHDLTRHLSNVKIKIEAECRRRFEEIDTNGSGFITVDEYSKFFKDSTDYDILYYEPQALEVAIEHGRISLVEIIKDQFNQA